MNAQHSFPDILSAIRDAWLIGRSDLWNRDYYLRTNPDVAAGARPALLHFVRHGGFEGREPSQSFDSAFYLAANPDIVRDRLHPLAHYLRIGRKERRYPVRPVNGVCNICEGQSFGHGPKGRYGILGQLPRCTSCQSLERHRGLRLVWKELPSSLLSGAKALQFSFDRSVDPAWFRTFELSQYGGENSMDLQEIPRDARTYDIVICNHVLEHVPDDRRAFSELSRILSDRGFLQVSFPEPLIRLHTDDWGYPKADEHDHFRRFGADAPARLRQHADIPGLSVLTKDPVTGLSDLIYFFSRSMDTLRSIKKSVRSSYCSDI